MQTIKNKLIGMALIGLIMGVIIAGTGYRSILKMNAAMGDASITSSIMRNHMLADMMHDALNSDVQSSLLAAETNDLNRLNEIDQELKEHSDIFIKSLKANENLITSKATFAALEKAFPDLRNYIDAANGIVKMAKSDRQAAMQRLDGFHRAFTTLEEDMEDISKMIQTDAEITTKLAAGEKDSVTTVLVLLTIAGASVLIFISIAIIKAITGSLNGLIHAAERVASGDLHVHIDATKDDEVGKLASAMEKMRVNLTEVISKIDKTTSKVLTSVEEISVVTSETTSNTSSQRSKTEQVAAAMNQMTSTVHDVSKNISATATFANKASEETRAGGEIVEDAIQSIKLLANQIADASEIINRFESNSHNIASVLAVIRGIAEQTNLLALNAAIEAARAGEQGRGFAVVADEVRTLASRTQQSTGEINDMIGQLQAGSKLSVEAMNKSREQAGLAVSRAEKAGLSLNSIAATVTRISDLSAQISTAATEQSAVSEEINRNINHINDAAVDTAKGTIKVADAIGDLGKMTAELQYLVRQFNV